MIRNHAGQNFAAETEDEDNQKTSIWINNKRKITNSLKKIMSQVANFNSILQNLLTPKEFILKNEFKPINV